MCGNIGPVAESEGQQDKMYSVRFPYGEIL